jgi:hypothetical protein
MVVMTTQSKIHGRVHTQWMALGAALVVLAGVLVAWALSNAADRVQVVQLSQAVAAGEVIGADDLMVTGLAYDTRIEGLVPARSLDVIVGRVAAIDLGAGVLLQTGMWRDAPLLGIGEHSVGVVLRPGRAPAGIALGDAAFAAPMESDAAAPPVLVRVIDIGVTPDGDLTLTLAVPEADAVAVARLAATDQLVLVGQSVGGGT